MEKTTGPSAMARLDNPVAHPSGAEGGAACDVVIKIKAYQVIKIIA
jgi:hypothetical protein